MTNSQLRSAVSCSGRRLLLVRSWPLNPPPGHARVEDGVIRVLIDNFDYRPLVEVDDDVVHLDWDTAVSLEDVREFAGLARAHPSHPLVVPMREYPGGMHGAETRKLTRPTWNVKRYDGQMTRYAEPGEATCHLFGFGMVYLPKSLVVEHAAALDPGVPFTDVGFSGWWSRNGERSAYCVWSIHPIHLNYPPPHLL